jgi:hypothetical protein
VQDIQRFHELLLIWTVLWMPFGAPVTGGADG